MVTRLFNRTACLTTAALWLVLSAASQACGQEATPPADIERMIRAGMVEALEARLGDRGESETLRWLAQAQVQKARSVRDAAQREAAFQDAERRYLKWIAAVEARPAGEPAQRALDLAVARAEYAGMILSHWVAADLDDFEITAGQRGDRNRLVRLFETARRQLEQAAGGIEKLAAEAGSHEDELLVLGIYDALRRTRLEIELSLAWANYQGGLVQPENPEARAVALRAAEQKFQGLLNGAANGSTRAQCLLGLGMALREQGRLDEAERTLAQALQARDDLRMLAQARYELARAQLAGGKFAEARVTVEPLRAKDLRNLAPEDEPAKFFISLAHLWDANSFLLEAARLRQQARGSPSRAAILAQAQRAQETGLARMNVLASLGGPWPTVVQLYVAANVDERADPRTLSPLQLLFAARQRADRGDLEPALKLVQEAAARPNVDQELAGRILFELGACHYRLGDARSAADVFARVAAEHRSHALAPQAATYAYQLWARLSEESGAKADYERLAATLLNLLQSFPEHLDRLEAVWLLPVALRYAGRYTEAAEQFGNVPRESPHWEEAQFRRVLCGRLACESQRASLGAEEFLERSRAAARALVQYAEQALQRARSRSNGEAARPAAGWSAESLVNAAEVLVSPGVDQFQPALELLSGFEECYPDSALLGRALGARLRAYRGLREFEQAARAVERYVQAVPPERAGAVLAQLAQGMQEEVERLQQRGELEAARRLAADSVPTFERLETWLRADAGRAKDADVAAFGLAQVYYLAEQFDPALSVVTRLLSREPANGNYRRLRALALTDQLGADATPAQIAAVEEAWVVLLRDPTLRRRAPERYWEARYNWLALRLRQGHADEVESAIRQERIWYPDLGGAPWRERLEALYQKVVQQGGAAASTQPAPQPTPQTP